MLCGDLSYLSIIHVETFIMRKSHLNQFNGLQIESPSISSN